jgi:DNA-binding NarL/FixJ family response regulator
LILLASSSQGIYARWKQGLRGFVQVSCVDNLDALRDDLARVYPSILLLDYDLPRLDGAEGVAGLMNLSPETRIIIFSNTLSDETEWELFKAGVWGCCKKDIDTKQLKNIVRAVPQGELWIRRSLTNRLLEELGSIVSEQNKLRQATSELLANLTQREHEIATLVGKGENNKQIANRLEISERTVKAHLTVVFRKLNIEDRLKLALVVTGSLGRPDQETRKQV